MLDERLRNAPVHQRGNGYEDLEPGRVFDHHGGRIIEAADNILFTTTLHYGTER